MIGTNFPTLGLAVKGEGVEKKRKKSGTLSKVRCGKPSKFFGRRKSKKTEAVAGSGK